MRIVYTVLNGRLAGGQMVCLQILRAARESGHEVCLVTPSRGELTGVLETEGVPVFLLPMERTFHFHRAWQFARLLKSWRADLVHCHSFGSGCTLARLGGWVAGLPVICHCHAHPNFNTNPIIRMAQVAIDNFTASKTAALIAVADAVKNSLVRQGIPAHKVCVIRNGVNVEAIPSEDERSSLLAELDLENKSETALVGYVGRLSERKGLMNLLDAARIVLAHRGGTLFLFLGEDHEAGSGFRRVLEAQAESLGIAEKVRFLGHRQDVSRLMRAFDVFVLPSWIEAMPMTILEAMAAGKAVVATPVGGVPEVVVDGKTGLLVSPRDPERLAQAILSLLENPEKARQFGDAGRERVEERFSRQKMIDRVMALYETAVRSGQRQAVEPRGGCDSNRH